jgi:FixJ family two-component response regulator
MGKVAAVRETRARIIRTLLVRRGIADRRFHDARIRTSGQQVPQWTVGSSRRGNAMDDRTDEIDARVHIVDHDDEGFRDSVTHVINASGLRAVSYRCTGEFLSEHEADAPGCVVSSLGNSGCGGLELLGQLGDSIEALPVIFMSGSGDVDLTVHALKAGAVDVLVKPVEADRLLHSVKKAIHNDVQRRANRAQRRKLIDRYATLSERERAVMVGVVEGKLNKQLAVELGTCERTIKSQRARLMRKLRLHSLADLVRAAKALELQGTWNSRLAYATGWD